MKHIFIVDDDIHIGNMLDETLLFIRYNLIYMVTRKFY